MIHHLHAASNTANHVFMWMEAVDLLLLYVYIQDTIKDPCQVNPFTFQSTSDSFSESQQSRESFLQQFWVIDSSRNSTGKNRQLL